VELLPRSSVIVALQLQLIESYQLATELVGPENSLRIRILPQIDLNSDGNGINANDDIDGGVDNIGGDPKSLGSNGGTSVNRLPLLPE
jgi:hypothetical protein